MNDTTAFLLAEQQRCDAQRRVPVRAVGLASVAACVVAVLLRVCARSTKPFKFPDNTFLIGLIFLLISHLSMLTAIFVGDTYVRRETRRQRVACQVQAVLTHWGLVALMLNAIYAVLVLYVLVVRRIPLSKIVETTRIYYVVVFGLPTVAVVACATVGGGYGPAEDDLCWIQASLDRFLWHLSFMVLGAVVCLGVTPPLVYALFKAYHSVDEPSRARIFRTMLVRLMCVSIYVVLLFGISLLTSLNQSILEGASEGSRAAHYVTATLYSYCMVRSFVVASMGLTVATILSVKKRHVRKMLSLVHIAERRGDGTYPRRHRRDHQRLQTSPNGFVVFTATRSPRSSGGRLLCPSAVDTEGRTAVSVPPDPQHHRAHLIASQAYTSYVLEHARELLIVQGSFSSESSLSLGRSTLESVLSGDSFASRTSYMSESTPRRRKSSSLSPTGDAKQLVTEL